MQIDGLEIPLISLQKANPMAEVFLQEAGQKSLVINGEFASFGNLKNQTMHAGPNKLMAVGLGSFSFQAYLTEVDSDVNQLSDAGPDMNLVSLNGNLSAALLRYDDDMLADLIVDRMSGGDRQALADSMAARVQMLYPADPETGAKAAKAMRNFIMGTNFLSVQMSTDAPVSIEDVKRHLAEGTIARSFNMRFDGG